jgi:hypothetical protein
MMAAWRAQETILTNHFAIASIARIDTPPDGSRINVIANW